MCDILFGIVGKISMYLGLIGVAHFDENFWLALYKCVSSSAKVNRIIQAIISSWPADKKKKES